jgi:rare lipoprotein A
MVLISAFAGNAGTTGLDLPLGPFVVHAASRPALLAAAPAMNTPTAIVPATTATPKLRGSKVSTLTHLKSGMASWYGKVFQDHTTASGRRFDKLELTAAHRDLPFGSRVKVTDLRNHRSVIVTITDRGTMTPNRVIDLSYAAADQLGIIQAGVAPVTLELLAQQNPIAAAHEMVASLR